MRKGFLLVAVVVAVFAPSLLQFVVPTAAEAVTPREEQLRFEIGTYLNAERKARGLSELPFEASLQTTAQRWSERNRQVNCQDNCHSTDSDSEILAWGGPDSKSGAIVDAFMRSTAHRNVLLHPRSVTMGVGFACATSGNVFVTVQYRGARKPVPETQEYPIVTPTTNGTSCDAPGGEAPAPPPPPPAPAPVQATPQTTAAPTPRPISPPTTQYAPIVSTTIPAPTTTWTWRPPATTTSTSTTSTSTTTTQPPRTTTTMGPPIEFDDDITLGGTGIATVSPRVNLELFAMLLRGGLILAIAAPFAWRRRRAIRR